MGDPAGDTDGGDDGADDLTPLEAAIAAVMLSLEPGDVVTYGEVAEEAGYPGRARAVGRFLKHHDGYPWWRVVNSVGRLVPNNEARQAELLRAEGVRVTDGRIRMRAR